MKALEDKEKKKTDGSKPATPSDGTSEPTESEEKGSEVKE